MPFTITQDYIDKLIDNAEIETFETHTTVIVALTLENGFTFVSSSGCIDPKKYDKEIGYNIAMKHIEDEIWKCEGYKINAEIGGMFK